jgi:hypothetical protein
MVYPLEALGRDDYPVRVGSMLLTLVDPHVGFEKAYNRWYERDHFYMGCMVGPWMFAGSRWVAPRVLKDLRWPHKDTVAKPWDTGSYVAIYWVEQGHHQDHFTDWAVPQVHSIYAQGRGFAERRHIHTVLFDRIGEVYRDVDGVPLDLALDARYDGIVIIWMDANGGMSAQQLHSVLAASAMPDLLKDSSIETASSWTPSPGEGEPKNAPMDLGSPAGGPDRLCQLLFCRGDVREVITRVKTYTDMVEGEGMADVQLVAPFFATQVGTDTYTDELW